MRPRFLFSAVTLFVLVLFSPYGWAQDGLGGALSRLENTRHTISDGFSPLVGIADFDNDQKPDGAILLDSVRSSGQRTVRIEIHLTAGQNNDLTFASDERALSISVLDINRDGAPDIVVEATFTHKRLHVWLNDGHGVFRKARTEDYPSNEPPPTRWQTLIPGQNCLAACLPTKAGSDVADPGSKPIYIAVDSGPLNLWRAMVLLATGPRAPNPSRGPPSYSL
jgi:hypothetical protein